MMKFIKVLPVIFIFLSLYANAASDVLALEALPAFSKNDRVLILAPHPDDEAIGTAGVIQKALAAGAQVKVVLLTYGENNEFSFIVYEKRLVFRKKEFIRLGEVRRQESLAAMEYLGMDPSDVLSLGYPDFGTMEIFQKYWTDVKPFRSMLSRVVMVPYETAYAPGSPYMGESILRDLKRIVYEYKPSKIFVSHPADINRDHRSLYLFTKVALWDLAMKIPTPALYPYIIHVVRWPFPRGDRPDLALDVPDQLALSAVVWRTLPLTSQEVLHKRNAIAFYQSQIKGAPQYLVAFARQNEIFGDYPEVHLEKQMASFVTWRQAPTGDEDLSSKDRGRPDHIHAIEYARQGDYLLIRMRLRHVIDRDLGLSVSLFGYSKEKAFASMPKLSLRVGLDGLSVYDKRKRIAHKDIQLTVKDKELLFRVPLSVMGNPDRVMTTAKTWVYDLTQDETAWRILSFQ